MSDRGKQLITQFAQEFVKMMNEHADFLEREQCPDSAWKALRDLADGIALAEGFESRATVH